MKTFALALALPFVATLAACDSSPSANRADTASDAMTSNDAVSLPADPATNDPTITPTAAIEADAPSANATHRFAGWAGKWTGVEGMYLVISPTTAERYSLEMQYDLDHKVTVEGRDSEHGIKFNRGGETLSLYRSPGNDTGLKYLAGKMECLKVKDGEGYCRD